MFLVSTNRSNGACPGFEHRILSADLNFHWSCEREGHSKSHLLMTIYRSGKWQVPDSSHEFSRLHSMNIITGGQNQLFSSILTTVSDCQIIPFLSLLLEIFCGHCPLCWWFISVPVGFHCHMHSKKGCQNATFDRLLHLQQANNEVVHLLYYMWKNSTKE